jgi:hypothetical protein
MELSKKLEQQIETLEDLPREELVQLWSKLMGSMPFKGARRVTLVRGIAYKLQAKRAGVLKASSQRQLLKIAHITLEGNDLNSNTADRKTGSLNKSSKPRLQTGSKLVREWNGRTYEIEVADKGFVLNDKIYRSLSACAKAITGAHWSGPRFFGAVS